MQTYNDTNTIDEAPLLRTDPCRIAVFPSEDSRPALRTFKQWMKLGYFPRIKIGHSVYLNPVDVRKALENRFTIQGEEEN